ncbi:MAG: late competence development ComFB family protein [Spirochaetales bacterium]
MADSVGNGDYIGNIKMKLKNYQEDIVLRAIEIALEDEPNLLADEDFVNDVAAYVLNRVPPRYVMSERGFLRLALEHADEEAGGKSMANIIELMMLVNRGLELVQSRRRSNDASLAPDDAEYEADVSAAVARDEEEARFELVHNFPQLIGRVVDARTADPVYGAIVKMSVHGRPALPPRSGWENPYITREKTHGHFSFWPHPIQSEEERLITTVHFDVNHPDYEPFHFDATVETDGSLVRSDVIKGDQIVSLDPFCLRSNDGA